MTDTTPSLPQAVLAELTAVLVRLHPEDSAHEPEISRLVCELGFALSRMGGESVPAWQPIETAPKDGTSIMGYWLGGKHDCAIHAVKFHRGRWWETNEDYPASEPTHWQPLPAAPTAPAQQAAVNTSPERVRYLAGIEQVGQQAADVQGERAVDVTICSRCGKSLMDARHHDEAAECIAAAQSVPKGRAVDRADAVNLARNVFSLIDNKGITPRGVETLADAVLRMDAALAASAPTVGGKMTQKDRDQIVAQMRKPGATLTDHNELLDSIVRALAAQEPSAAAEPVAERVETLQHFVRRMIERLDAQWKIAREEFGREKAANVFHNLANSMYVVRDAANALATPPTPPSAPAGGGEGERSVRAVAVVVEQMEGLDGPHALVRWIFNPVPEGQELLWDHGPSAPPPHEGEDARDAARYRWLRHDHAESAVPVVWMCNESAEADAALFGEDLDAAIDAARAGGSQ